MAGKPKHDTSPRINNRRATHDYFISAKLECGVALVGSEVKSLRDGKAQLQDAYARIENGELFLHGAHIDPYEKAALAYNHDPRRTRKLLAHRREIKKLEAKPASRARRCYHWRCISRTAARRWRSASAAASSSTTSARRSARRKW